MGNFHLPIYVKLHTVISLLVHLFLQSEASLPIHQLQADASARRCGSVGLSLYTLDTAMGLSGVLVASGRTLGGLIARVATGVVS